MSNSQEEFDQIMEACRSEILLAARVQKLEKQLKELIQTQTSQPQASTLAQEALEQVRETLINRLLSDLVESLGSNLRTQLQSQLEPLMKHIVELELKNKALEDKISDRLFTLSGSQTKVDKTLVEMEKRVHALEASRSDVVTRLQRLGGRLKSLEGWRKEVDVSEESGDQAKKGFLGGLFG
jgi:chromosome segregation ATPase